MSNKYSDIIYKIDHTDKNYLTFTDEEVGIIRQALTIADDQIPLPPIALPVEDRLKQLASDGMVKHFPIGVDADGNGPVSLDDPNYARTVCWCGTEGCKEYE